MFNQIKKVLTSRGSFIKTLYYNFKYLKISDAIKLPMIISRTTKISGKGKINIDNPRETIYIGQKTLNWMDESKEYTNLYLDGSIEFLGKVYIGLGTKIEIKKYGNLKIGNNVTFTGGSKIICNKKIYFGNDCLISWDTLIMDSDGHTILDNNNINIDKPIIIGNHTWIGCNSIILKNTKIFSNTVIASGSIVSGNYIEKNILLSVDKAKKLKSQIKWDINYPSN